MAKKYAKKERRQFRRRIHAIKRGSLLGGMSQEEEVELRELESKLAEEVELWCITHRKCGVLEQWWPLTETTGSSWKEAEAFRQAFIAPYWGGDVGKHTTHVVRESADREEEA